MSKQKLVSVMDKKINTTDSETKQLEKALYKGSID